MFKIYKSTQGRRYILLFGKKIYVHDLSRAQVTKYRDRLIKLYKKKQQKKKPSIVNKAIAKNYVNIVSPIQRPAPPPPIPMNQTQDNSNFLIQNIHNMLNEKRKRRGLPLLPNPNAGAVPAGAPAGAIPAGAPVGAAPPIAAGQRQRVQQQRLQQRQLQHLQQLQQPRQQTPIQMQRVPTPPQQQYGIPQPSSAQINAALNRRNQSKYEQHLRRQHAYRPSPQTAVQPALQYQPNVMATQTEGEDPEILAGLQQAYDDMAHLNESLEHALPHVTRRQERRQTPTIMVRGQPARRGSPTILVPSTERKRRPTPIDTSTPQQGYLRRALNFVASPFVGKKEAPHSAKARTQQQSNVNASIGSQSPISPYVLTPEPVEKYNYTYLTDDYPRVANREQAIRRMQDIDIANAFGEQAIRRRRDIDIANAFGVPSNASNAGSRSQQPRRAPAKKTGIHTVHDPSNLDSADAIIDAYVKKYGKLGEDSYRKMMILQERYLKDDPDPLRYIKSEKEQEDDDRRLYAEAGRSYPSQQTGSGNSKYTGLYDNEINEVMKRYPEYKGTIMLDEVNKILPEVTPNSRGGFIINLGKSDTCGYHWTAVYYDARPEGTHTIEYFNSFGKPMPELLQKEIKGLVAHLKPTTYLKLKENKIVEQGDTNNCGYFAMNFLINRFRGKPFKDVTGYSEIEKSEKNIEKLKQTYKPFEIIGA